MRQKRDSDRKRKAAKTEAQCNYYHPGKYVLIPYLIPSYQREHKANAGLHNRPESLLNEFMHAPALRKQGEHEMNSYEHEDSGAESHKTIPQA